MLTDIRARLRASLRAFWGGGNWVDSNAAGNRYSSGTGRTYWIPGTHINWDAVTGDLWECPAVQACLNWLYRNAPQAPPQVTVTKADGSTETVPNHPLTILLNRPNPLYDWTILVQGLLLSLETNGNAFILAERTRGTREPAELWWLPHHCIKPRAMAGDPRPIAYWEYWQSGTLRIIQPEDMVHIRFGMDPYDPRLGLSPLASATRGVYTLQQAVSYEANILRNHGTVGTILSAKDPNMTFDPAEVKAAYKAQTTGDNVGSVFASDVPLDVHHPGVTPQQLTLDTLPDRPEADVAALIGLPPQAVGLHVGRLSKTYANVREAREAAWEEKLMPTLNLIGCQIGYALLPQLQASQANEALGFDYSNVRPLQPDLDALHARAREDWKANLIDLAQWKQAVGMKPDAADSGVYYRDVAGGPTIPAAATPQDVTRALRANGNGAHKAPTDWAARVEAELAVLHGASE